MLVAPALFLLLLEGVLRLAGVGYPTSFWVENKGGQPAGSMATNLRFGWRYFPPRVSRWPRPQAVLPEKTADSLRVLVLGESAAFGTPSELYGMQRILQLQLEAMYPERKVEVLNGAMTAINSHALVEVARDSCAKLRPDWVVIYMGNNEVVGPFGGGSVFGHFSKSRAVIHGTLALEGTAIAQGFNALTDPAGTQGGKFEKWEGMANFIGQQVPANDPRLPTIYGHFQANLLDILRHARESGAKTLLCTVPVNLRDCPPFMSAHGPDFPKEKTAEFDQAMALGEREFDAGNFEAAKNAFFQAKALDKSHALASWLYVRSMDSMMPSKGIGLLYADAIDKDLLRFRCDQKLNDLIRGSAEGARAYLLDLEHLANKDEAAGNNLFYEHVHPNFHGNFLFGSRMAEWIRSVEDLERIDPELAGRALDASHAPLDEPTCRRELAYSPLEELRVTGSMVEGLLAQPPFTLQWRHEQRYGALRQQWDAAKIAMLSTQAVTTSITWAEAAYAARPEDLHVAETYLNTYARLGGDGRGKAIAAARKILAAVPGNYLARTQLADLLAQEGKLEEARREYETALQANPYYHVARNNLGALGGK
jgi:Flp pilus assembly protein TadD/lysophospholipase L1-like esterase